MIVDISPQWKKLANWWWDMNDDHTFGNEYRGMSIYEMLTHEYGAFKVGGVGGPHQVIIDFPSEAAYSMFLLRWS